MSTGRSETPERSSIRELLGSHLKFLSGAYFRSIIDGDELEVEAVEVHGELSSPHNEYIKPGEKITNIDQLEHSKVVAIVDKTTGERVLLDQDEEMIDRFHFRL